MGKTRTSGLPPDHVAPLADAPPDADRTVTYAEAADRTVAYDEYPTVTTEAAVQRAATGAALADRTSPGGTTEDPPPRPARLATEPRSPSPRRSTPVAGAPAARPTPAAPAAPAPAPAPARTIEPRPAPRRVTESPPLPPLHPVFPRLPPALPPPITFTSLPPPPPLPGGPRARSPGGPDTRPPTQGEARASDLCERSEPSESEGTENACAGKPSPGSPSSAAASPAPAGSADQVTTPPLRGPGYVGSSRGGPVGGARPSHDEENACAPKPSPGYPWLSREGAHEAPFAPVPSPVLAETDGDSRPTAAAIVPPAVAAAPTAARAVRTPFLPPPAPAAPARPRVERRPLPRAARVTIAAVGAVVLALFVLSRQSGPKPPAEPRLALEDKLAVSEEDLKRRREVKPEDLRPREIYIQPPPSPPPVAAPPAPAGPGPSTDALAERRKRRANDPNDVLTHRARPAPPSSEPPPMTGEADLYRRPLGASGTQAKGGAVTESAVPKKRLTTGSTLRGTLAAPLRLRGGTAGATAIATLDRSAGPLRGARLLGQASLAGDRLDLRFRKMVLPSGDEVSVQAEAQSLDGAFGLPVAIDEPEEDGDGSLIGDVATDAATDVVSDVLGVGIPARAAGNYIQRSRSRSSKSSRRVTTVELPAGTPLLVFFHEAAELP